MAVERSNVANDEENAEKSVADEATTCVMRESRLHVRGLQNSRLTTRLTSATDNDGGDRTT